MKAAMSGGTGESQGQMLSPRKWNHAQANASKAIKREAEEEDENEIFLSLN